MVRKKHQKSSSGFLLAQSSCTLLHPHLYSTCEPHVICSRSCCWETLQNYGKSCFLWGLVWIWRLILFFFLKHYRSLHSGLSCLWGTMLEPAPTVLLQGSSVHADPSTTICRRLPDECETCYYSSFVKGSLVPSAGPLKAISAEFSSQQSWVGGSEGPSNAAGERSSLKGKFSETMQRC